MDCDDIPKLVVYCGGPPKLGHGLVSPFIPIKFIIPLSFAILRVIYLFRNTKGVGEESHFSFFYLSNNWQNPLKHDENAQMIKQKGP